jgi:hypothetical protein
VTPKEEKFSDSLRDQSFDATDTDTGHGEDNTQRYKSIASDASEDTDRLIGHRDSDVDGVFMFEQELQTDAASQHRHDNANVVSPTFMSNIDLVSKHPHVKLTFVNTLLANTS